ncbi:MAG: tetratricopeptide repeat protein [Planctomycetales bacterium]|nr:tetratricopeptide repeat protein [Planctomycetales bacterium]
MQGARTATLLVLASCGGPAGLPDTPYNRGVAAYDAGRFPEAGREFRRAAEIAPSDPRPLFNAGLSYDRLGEARMAEKFYREALRVSPDHAEAHVNLAALLADRSLDDEAATHYAAARESDPASAFPLVAEGAFHERRGRLADAERLYREAAAKEPAHAPAWYRFGTLLARAGRADEARKALDEALAKAPEDLAALRARAALAEADPQTAIPLWKRILLLDESDAAAWHALGRASLAVGDPERAAQALWQARDRCGADRERAAGVAEDLRKAYEALGSALPK